MDRIMRLRPLMGCVSNISGDTSGVWGTVRPGVCGDATGLVGDISHVWSGDIAALSRAEPIPQVDVIISDDIVLAYDPDLPTRL